MVSFTVDRNGRVIARSVVHSSGIAALDQEALAMVLTRRAVSACSGWR